MCFEESKMENTLQLQSIVNQFFIRNILRSISKDQKQSGFTRKRWNRSHFTLRVRFLFYCSPLYMSMDRWRRDIQSSSVTYRDFESAGRWLAATLLSRPPYSLYEWHDVTSSQRQRASDRIAALRQSRSSAFRTDASDPFSFGNAALRSLPSLHAYPVPSV